MNRSDIQFRKNCQFYHTRVNKLLKKGEIQQAQELIDKVARALSEWEDVLRSARFKVNLLKNIYADLVMQGKRANYKLDRRQEDNDSE